MKWRSITAPKHIKARRMAASDAPVARYLRGSVATPLDGSGNRVDLPPALGYDRFLRVST